MSDQDGERSDRGADLGDRIAAAKAALEEKPGPNVGAKYNALSLAWRMTLELAVGTCIGFAIGWGLDNLTGWGPAFMIVFGLFGFVAGAKVAISTAQDVSRRSSEEDAAKGEDAPPR